VAATVNIRAVRYLLLGWAKDVPLTDINHFRTGNKADVRFRLGGLLGISWAQVLGESMTSVLEERALVSLNQLAVSSALYTRRCSFDLSIRTYQASGLASMPLYG
jgi:hypothetical protein